MEETGVKRKLTVILAADVAGYSRLMGADEEATHKTLRAYREIIDGLIARHDGRIFSTAGDSVVAEFASPVEAVRAAISIQEELRVRNSELPEDRRMRFRIGINLGDVIVDGDDIYGDGVNVAARLEGVAEPGGICVSGGVFDQVKNKLSVGFEDIGAQEVKNIAEPVPAFRIVAGPVSVAPGAKPTRKPSAAPRWRKVVIAAGMAVVVLTAGAAVWNFYLRGPARLTEVASEARMAFPLPDKPSIAVLPFNNLTGDPEQEYLSDGFTENVITALARIPRLFVIARHSSFTYKGKPVKVSRVAEELGVRYVLEGSIQRSGSNVRITAQLVDAIAGHHLWAERYDRELKEIFALHDEISEKIVAALEIKLTQPERMLLARRHTANLKANDLFLRAKAYRTRFTKPAVEKARQMLEKAIDLDPRFAVAYAELSLIHFLEAIEWNEGPRVLERGFEMAQKAVALNDSLAVAHSALGWIYLWKKQHEQAILSFKRAVTLDRNNAEGYSRLATTLAFAGRANEAISHAKKAMRLDPQGPAIYPLHLGIAYYFAGRYEEAIDALKEALARSPDMLPAYRKLAAVYVELGRLDEARAQIAHHMKVSPAFSLDEFRQRIPIKDRATLERYIETLRKAGLPEHTEWECLVRPNTSGCF